ncbi:glycosyltransferase [Lunatibacter salilacus]|uniref:glycosyltransferase n=1 Tax=Lunatibacter salilacus TaxID=2483804 RepID=UPI00131DC822|nr:glycosyltransferase [Lunatibacter salilacus]
MKILIVHNRYTQAGGEDYVVDAELAMLRGNGVAAEVLFYQNPSRMLSQIFGLILSPFNVRSYFQFKKILREIRPTLVHIHNWHYTASPSLIWAAGSLGIPVVLTIHNYRLICPSATLFHRGKLYLKSINSWGLLSAIKNRVYRDSFFATAFLALALKFNRKIGTWKKVDGFIFLNDFMRDIHHRALPDVAGVPNFIKPNFTVNIPLSSGCDISSRDGFLFVGRLSTEKGVEVLLQAFSESGLPLKIIGDGPMRGLVERYVSEFANIIYVGYQKKEYILHAMGVSRWLVFPSIWYEGMPITILEAFMAATPVIASRIGSLPSIVKEGENGILFPPNEVNGLKDALKIAANMSLSDYSRYSVYCSDSFQKDFTEGENFKELSKIYEKIIDKSI